MIKQVPVAVLVIVLLGCSTSNKAIEKEIVALYQEMNGEVYHDRKIVQQQEMLRSELVERGHMERKEYILEVDPESVTWDEAESQIQKALTENENKSASVTTRAHLVNYEQKGLVITVCDLPSQMEAWDKLIGTVASANQAR